MSDIKRRIRSTVNMQQITKTMKLVSASKLRRAQNDVITSRPYAVKILTTLRRMAATNSLNEHPFLQSREVKKICYVLYTSDKGLCGGFNANVIKACEQSMKEQDTDVCLFAVGKRGLEYFKRRDYEIAAEYVGMPDVPSFDKTEDIAQDIMDRYLNGEFDEVRLVFSEFYSAMSCQPIVSRLLPLANSEETIAGAEKDIEEEYLFEPSDAEILNALVPACIRLMVFRGAMESKASEHGARMTAMTSASDNAAEIIHDLTLAMNRARQAAITTEITEIVGGAAALE